MSVRNVLQAVDPEHQQPGPDGWSDAALLAHSERIAEAYAQVFSGSGTKLDGEIVLVDLALYTRYYDTAMANASAEDVKAFDARRAVFQRVLEAMTLAGQEPQGLHRAVLTAPPIDTREER